jgi:hypothetical protein
MKQEVTHKTKYDVGDKVFWIDKNNGLYSIQYDQIKSINIGGKNFNKYEVSYQTRGEKDLFDNFGEAKNNALIMQEKLNKENIETITNFEDPSYKQ